MKLDLKPHHYFLLKKSVIKCGFSATAIGSAINAILFRQGETIAYCGVQIFFSTFTTALICNLVYCKIYDEKKSLESPPLPYDLDKHVLYKYFPKEGKLKQSTFLAVVTTLIIGVLPALMLIITGLGVESTIFEWVGCKLVCSLAYSPFTAYHMIAYRVTYYQRAAGNAKIV